MAGTAEDTTDAFSIIGDENRTAIVRALVDHRGEHPEEPALSFTALQERSGIDDKGNFNYHLDRLTDAFVKKTDDGYELTGMGGKMAGVLLSGKYSDRVERAETDRQCPVSDCEAPVTVRLRAGRTRVRCADDHLLFMISVPPGAAAGRGADEILAVASFYWQQVLALHSYGVCVECFGHEVGEVEPRDHPETGETVYVYRSNCDNCGLSFCTTPGAVLVHHPAMVSLYHDHGVDVRDRPPWRLSFNRWENHEVVSEDPLRLRVTAEVEGDRVHVELDRSGAVLTVTGE